MKKRGLFIIFAAIAALVLVGGVSAFFTMRYLLPKEKYLSESATQPINQPLLRMANLSQDGSPVDFTYAAEQTVHAVVHVKTYYASNQYEVNREPSIWDFFFGIPYENDNRYRRQEPAMPQGSGSGVIISSDGYIVTNNHVIERASVIEVTLNNKQTFKAKVIGTDPSSDIALIKIDATSLHYLTFGDSDNLKVGEWVLAVGNPFNLTSTVTAGIVSAKGRSLGIIPGEMKIESFIQTDAAVNPGNSGGALVNTRGELIGINTAIASYTGNYAGYSFAIPASIANKVVQDLKEHGVVQRALLGVRMVDLDSETAKRFSVDTKDYNGVLIVNVEPGSAADKAGIQKDDIITQVNGVSVNSSSDVQEQISRFRPNDKVQVSIIRKGSLKQFDVVLRNKAGSTELVKSNDAQMASLGATFKELTDREKAGLGIRYGVQVAELSNGKLKDAGVKKGYVIFRVDNTPINSIEAINEAISGAGKSTVFIEGVYPNGQYVPYELTL